MQFGRCTSVLLASEVREECVLALYYFTTFMEWVLGKVVNPTHSGASVCNMEVTDLVFPDNIVHLAALVRSWP